MNRRRFFRYLQTEGRRRLLPVTDPRDRERIRDELRAEAERRWVIGTDPSGRILRGCIQNVLRNIEALCVQRSAFRKRNGTAYTPSELDAWDTDIDGVYTDDDCIRCCVNGRHVVLDDVDWFRVTPTDR